MTMTIILQRLMRPLEYFQIVRPVLPPCNVSKDTLQQCVRLTTARDQGVPWDDISRISGFSKKLRAYLELFAKKTALVFQRAESAQQIGAEDRSFSLTK